MCRCLSPVKTLTGVSVLRLMGLKLEAWAMATVNHPAIAHVYGIESWRSRPFLVVELLPGGTLADRLRRGPVPASRAVAIGALLADALAALHEAGYMHGDIKPSNVGFTSDGSPKLLDFGLARETSDAAATRGGTVRYLSPEVLSGRPGDEADDVWFPGLCRQRVVNSLHSPGILSRGATKTKADVASSGSSPRYAAGCPSRIPAQKVVSMKTRYLPPASQIVTSGRLSSVCDGSWSTRPSGNPGMPVRPSRSTKISAMPGEVCGSRM